MLLGVHDPLLPENSGCYLVGPDGVRRTDTAPELELDVRWLAGMYLGDVAPSTVATAGRVTVHDEAALRRADALFRTPVSPWCGTFF